MKLNIIVLVVCLGCFEIALGQNNRLNTNNNIGWYNYFGTFKVAEKFGIHTEYQWRRNNYITDWQQSLLRVGLNYNLNPRVLFRVGYAWIETYPYGDIPLNGLGRDFTEHRIFEMVQLSHKEGIVDFSHRFMLEQRFVGRYTSANEATEDEFPLLNRMRYMVRLQIPRKTQRRKGDSAGWSAGRKTGQCINIRRWYSGHAGCIYGCRLRCSCNHCRYIAAAPALSERNYASQCRYFNVVAIQY
jgi:hypothetical protein